MNAFTRGLGRLDSPVEHHAAIAFVPVQLENRPMIGAHGLQPGAIVVDKLDSLQIGHGIPAKLDER